MTMSRILLAAAHRAGINASYRSAAWRGANSTTMAATEAQSLVFAHHGEPENALALQTQALPAPGPDEIRVQLIAAPINPSDINTIQGKYPISPKLPGVPGHEGVGRVLDVGSQVRGLQPGNLVVPLEGAQGTWRSAGNFKAEHWHRVPDGLPTDAAAMLCINPPTALRMLEGFVELQPGDTLIQNGATSAVGQHVIQLARARGIKTINLIRDRPDWDDTVAWLKGMGADVVTTEEHLKQDIAAAGLAPPALALNCIGGSAASAVAKALRQGGTMVTYGAMSMQPLTLPTSLLIFKDLRFRGFWLSGQWSKEAGREGKAALLDHCARAFLQGELLAPEAQQFPLSQYREALEVARSGLRRKKVLLVPA